MSNERDDDTTFHGQKFLSFLHRNYLLLKAHYFFSYATFASVVPILNLILRGRGFTDAEISYINLVIPFLVFLTNPILGLFADRDRCFRRIFNLVLISASILFLVMFFLPSIKFKHIQGRIHRIHSMNYSLKFCASADFTRKCASRVQCGCIHQATCTIPARQENEPVGRFDWNFTMNSTHAIERNRSESRQKDKPGVCSVDYHVSIGSEAEDLSIDDAQPILCEVKCSIPHLCTGRRDENQTIRVLLYGLLIILGLNLFANATAIGTAIGFATLPRANLFGRQRVWGTLAYGLTAFLASRLYAYFQTDYVYFIIFISSSILTVLITSFIRIRPQNQKKDEAEEGQLGIRALLPLLKRVEVVVFFLVTFAWGMSFAVLDPYLMLYIDEIDPCQSHSAVGYITLVTATVEVLALFIAHKLITKLGKEVTTVVIFAAFALRFTAYIFIRQSYWFLPVEIMHFFNFGILFVLVSEEAFSIAPPGLHGTLQLVVNGVCVGLGRGTGLLVSFFLYTRMTKWYLFVFYAALNVVGALVYTLYCLFSKRTDDVSGKMAHQTERNPNEQPLL